MTIKANILKRFLEAQDRLVIQAADLSLGTISNMVERKAIDVNPPYQRRERWSLQKQSALIESFLLNVPVPPIYLAEDEFGKYSVVDGKQRITSIHSFMTNNLTLNRLESFQAIDGCQYNDLPSELRNALEVRPYLRVITLLKQSDPMLKFEVFTRLNRGGESMAAQELRNVAFRGALNTLIYSLSNNPFLRRQLKIKDSRSPAYQNMTDAELVLRFFALRANWRQFSGDYRTEMDNFMLHNREPSTQQLRELKTSFESAINTCERIWGDYAFKRPEGNGWRDQLLTGMYDAQMVAVDMLRPQDRNKAVTNSRSIKIHTRKLFEDNSFDIAVRQGTNTPSRVVHRIDKVKNILSL